MSDGVENGGAQPAATEQPPAQSAQAVSEALARVQEAAAEVRSGELRESLEKAIEVIDDVASSGATGTADLNAVADALEGALDELEHGKVANLAPVIEQAQSIIPP
ncbi:MAG TPA: hypothetical protein VJ779_03555 [Acetobacteraceae bacterium]|nr:hypothetical protein [Acetobacteraceae bacterium]